LETSQDPDQSLVDILDRTGRFGIVGVEEPDGLGQLKMDLAGRKLAQNRAAVDQPGEAGTSAAGLRLEAGIDGSEYHATLEFLLTLHSGRMDIEFRKNAELLFSERMN
jgi:hypothetical protein